MPTSLRDIIMRRRGNHLVPISPFEEEAILGYPENKDLWITIRRKRSKVHLDKYWVMLDRTLQSGRTKYHSISALHKAIKWELGFVKPVLLLSGEMAVEPDSIAFDKMDQGEFNLFYEAAMRLIGEYYGINPDEG